MILLCFLSWLPDEKSLGILNNREQRMKFICEMTGVWREVSRKGGITEGVMDEKEARLHQGGQ